MTTPEADPADLAEQALLAVPEAALDGPLGGGIGEASEADVADQAREVPEPDDEYPAGLDR